MNQRWTALLALGLGLSLFLFACNGQTPGNSGGGGTPPSFTLSLNPSSLTVQQGNSAQTTLTVTPQNGFQGQVSFSLVPGQEGVPQGLSFSPASVNVIGSGPVNQALTISASSSTPTGTYRIKVRGTAGSLTKEADLTVTVSAPSGGGTGPQAWYFSPADFHNGVLTFRLPSTSLTKALIALVPGMSPAEFYQDSNYWLVPFNFTLERGSFSPTAASPKPIPAPKTIPLQNWGKPLPSFPPGTSFGEVL